MRRRHSKRNITLSKTRLFEVLIFLKRVQNVVSSFETEVLAREFAVSRLVLFMVAVFRDNNTYLHSINNVTRPSVLTINF